MTWWSSKVARHLRELSGYAAGRVLTGVSSDDPTWQVAGAGSSPVQLVLTNTVSITDTTPTDVLSTTIGADAVGASHALYLKLYGDHLNNSGGNRSYRIVVSLNGVTLWDDNSQLFATNAQWRPWSLEVFIGRVTSTTCWLGGAGWNCITSTTDPTTGIGPADSTGVTGSPIGSDETTDPTVAWGSSQTLAVQATISGSTATFRRRGGFVMIL